MPPDNVIYWVSVSPGLMEGKVVGLHGGVTRNYLPTPPVTEMPSC